MLQAAIRQDPHRAARSGEPLVHHGPQIQTEISSWKHTGSDQPGTENWRGAAVLVPGETLGMAHPLERSSGVWNYIVTMKDHIPQTPDGPCAEARGFCSPDGLGEGCNAVPRCQI